MSKRRRKSISRVALATAFILIATFDTPATIPAIPESRPTPPSPEEVRVLEELMDFVRGGPRETGFRMLKGTRMTEAVRSSPRSFALFRTYNPKRERFELIESMPYAGLIRRAAERHDVDPLLLASVIEAESGFNPQAVSPVGALGLMQIMPSTADFLGGSDPLEPAANIELGARYLSSMLRLFDGDVALALAAYNAGPGNVERFEGLPPFRETRRYVERVLTRYVDHHQEIWQSTGAVDWLY